MKMHGFLEEPRGLGHIEDMLHAGRAVVTANESHTVREVIALLRDHGISQVPVTDKAGKPAGLVHEIDILRGLQRGTVTIDSPVRDIENKIGGIVSPKARVEELYGIFAAEQAAIVMDEGRIVGVLSEIDLIEHLARCDQHAGV
jgi:cystathionine beta-synthase